jgi:hypothetical protein
MADTIDEYVGRGIVATGFRSFMFPFFHDLNPMFGD